MKEVFPAVGVTVWRIALGNRGQSCSLEDRISPWQMYIIENMPLLRAVL